VQQFKQLAQEASRKRQELTKSRGGPQRNADLKDGSKWGFVDLKQLGQLLGQFEPDLLELKELRADLRQKVRQIESKMLKGRCMRHKTSPETDRTTAGTRKEEIARFTKAQSDKEFSKMLKTRTLGPEHLETQTQLRRSIRVSPTPLTVMRVLTGRGRQFVIALRN
jgi:nucleoporin NUP159